MYHMVHNVMSLMTEKIQQQQIQIIQDIETLSWNFNHFKTRSATTEYYITYPWYYRFVVF